jgi:superfamily II DNA or RNA helicase
MEQSFGYIYIRRHASYEEFNACKLGKTSSILERDVQYATGEIKRGHFEVVYEVSVEEVDMLERSLQHEFHDINIRFDAGTEFYDKQIITLIEPYLVTLDIKFRKLHRLEICKLLRVNKRKKSQKPQIVSYMPRDDQKVIIKSTVTHLQQNDKCMLVLTCGVGKTLISLWTASKLKSMTVLIGVPNILLLKQWREKVCVIFKNFPLLVVSGTTSMEDISKFLESNQNGCIIITTYASAHKVYNATKNINFVLELKILDEVHHLTSSNMMLAKNTKKYIQILNIQSSKQLSLTATIKQLDNLHTDNKVISNNDVNYFGEIIEQRNLYWAINEKIVCDYVIQTVITSEEQLQQQQVVIFTNNDDKRLFLSAYAALRSISDGCSHHLLIYSNNQDNAMKLTTLIKMLLDNYFDIDEIYYSGYHSHMKPKEQKEILQKFEKSRYGVITCVYCLGEGWDFPILDAVVFAENMTSNIRILQSALRAGRKNPNESNKITKIILPVLNTQDWLDNSGNPDLRKVREVIYQMGLEDESIEHKIHVLKMDVVKQERKIGKDRNIVHDVFDEYDEEFTHGLRLRTVKRLALTITYEMAKSIIAGQNIRSKEAYYELCDRDYRLSKEPDIIFHGQFTNWVEYLGVARVYYDLNTCRVKVNEYLLQFPKLQEHYLDLSVVSKELCKLDSLFPPYGFWTEYYNVKELSGIIDIKKKKKKCTSDILQ